MTRLPLFNSRLMRQLMRISTDVVGKLPSSGDGVVVRAVKCLAVYDSVCRFAGTRGESSLPAFVESLGGAGSLSNAHLVRLFFSTEVRERFRLSRVPFDEHTDVVVAEGEGGTLFFVEWRWGATPDRSDRVWHSAGFDFGRMMAVVWSYFNDRIHVDFRDSGRGLEACYGAVPREDFELGEVAASRLHFFVEQQRAYDRDGVSRNYLVVGPPGVGKTTFVLRAVAKLGGRMLRVSSLGLEQMRADELEFLLGNLDPHHLVVDDLDKADVNKALPKLLQVLAELKLRRPGMTTFLTAARADFDAALLRPGRIDERVVFGPPPFQERLELLQRFAPDTSLVCLRRLAQLGEGLAAAHLREVALQLRYRAEPMVEKLVMRMVAEVAIAPAVAAASAQPPKG